MDIDQQIKEKEESLKLLKLQKEKQQLIKDGVLKVFENNILKDVHIARYNIPDGENVVITFKLNDDPIEIVKTILREDYLQRNNMIAEEIAENVKNALYKMIINKY